MTLNEIWSELLEKSGKSKAQIGRAVGIPEEKKPSDRIGKRMQQENISIDKMKEMLDELDYEIVLIPRGEKKKKEWYSL